MTERWSGTVGRSPVYRFDMLGRPWVSYLFLAVAVGGCNGKSDASTGTETETSGDTGVSPGGDGGSADGAATQDGGASTSGGGTGGGDGGSDTAGEDTSGSGSGGTGTNDPGNPLDCGGTIYACGNGMDDDGDGFVDLDDPECTGPCDDDESSFQTGIPGDNKDCKQDCFFDGNSGQGDDGCNWDLRCDPANPGANVNCEYTGGNNCNNGVEQTPMCIEFCEQYVPPGCDCFGCCTVQTPDGPVDIFLNSGPDCSLDNLEGCQTCTQQTDCGNECVPEECELCFGETELPEGCDDGNQCTDTTPCTVNEDCSADYFCYLGCCYPPPPG